MIIGGIERRFDVVSSPFDGENSLAIEFVVRTIRQHWPGSVFQLIGGEVLRDFASIPFGMIDELLIYKDRNSLDSWDSEGLSPQDCNTMVHVIASDRSLTIVFDESDAEMNSIVDSLSPRGSCLAVHRSMVP